jgi:monofunctional biosynthetic peptidoglycan transglycosylase
MLRQPAKPSPGMERIARLVQARTTEFGQRAACVSPTGSLAL